MKKTTILMSAVIIAAFAFTGCKKEEKEEAKPQVNVPKENNSLTQKVTGTRCPPCGSWGWEMMDELMNFGQSKSFFISTYSQNFVAEGFITPTATEMDKQWKLTGYPSFVANGKPMLSRASGVNTNEEKQMCKNEMDAHRSAAVIANVGIEKSFNGNTMKVKTSTQFFANASGNYNMAMYVVENDAMWKQSGHPNGANAIPHHYVLRGSVNGTWGQSVSTGDVASGKFFDKDFTYDVDAAWNKDKISVVAVIWKLDGAKYVFVNTNKTK